MGGVEGGRKGLVLLRSSCRGRAVHKKSPFTPTAPRLHHPFPVPHLPATVQRPEAFIQRFDLRLGDWQQQQQERQAAGEGWGRGPRQVTRQTWLAGRWQGAATDSHAPLQNTMSSSTSNCVRPKLMDCPMAGTRARRSQWCRGRAGGWQAAAAAALAAGQQPPRGLFLRDACQQ